VTKIVLLFISLVALEGCLIVHPSEPTSAPNLLAAPLAANSSARAPDGSVADAQQIVLVVSGDEFFWNGWLASQKDLPNLIKEFHPHSVVLTAQKNAVVDFQLVLNLRDAIISAGVKNVTIGSGGVSGG
jgi:biopolymer transport protein ExbD